MYSKQIVFYVGVGFLSVSCCEGGGAETMNTDGSTGMGLPVRCR